MYCHLYAHSDKQRMQHPFPDTSTCIPSFFHTLLNIETLTTFVLCIVKVTTIERCKHFGQVETENWKLC